MKYGRVIRMVRGAREKSQKQLAVDSQLNPSYISLVEAGKRIPSLPAMQEIAKALDVPLHVLMLMAGLEAGQPLSDKQASELGRILVSILD